MTFKNAILNKQARTDNGMKALKSTSDSVVDLFYKVGASRGKDIVPQFVAAFAQNKEYALRVAQWARDIREGSGERKVYRDILMYLAKNDTDSASLLLKKTPELGRWDDVLVLLDTDLKDQVVEMIRKALEAGDGLCAKWMPRKDKEALVLRKALGYSPKYYRKRLVELSKVVETQMCAKNWNEINFNHVPSVASSRYKKAFHRNAPKYAEYVAQLVKQLEKPEIKKTAKVNASAIFPHDVLAGRIHAEWSYRPSKDWSKTELDMVNAQWAALPNYVGDKNVLGLVDVSGSMDAAISGKTTALEIAVSLGLYFADKNTGKFKDCFLTFSSSPELLVLKGNINQKIDQMVKSTWHGSTNLHAAFEKILDTAVKGKVDPSEMPETLIIFSDMQFNSCVRYDDSAIQMIRRKYESAGYTAPNVVFWNLNSRDNVPVSVNEKGVALVSGFSPTIAKTILSSDGLEEFTPRGMMMKTIMKERYDI